MSDSDNQLRKAFRLVEQLEAEIASLRRAEDEPVAIVGLSCRFPRAESAEAFWALLESGEDAISEVPPDRWDVDSFYDPDPDAPGKMSTRRGGFLKDIDRFDAQFFNISPREATLMDPQQRVLLELSWEALEDAGLSSDTLYGSPTGVFVGVCASDYGRLALQRTENINAYWGTGNVTSVAAGRVAYTFGFTGPCLAIDTACSSALVAVHCACDSLRKGECDTALAASVNLILAPEATVAFSKARMMSPDGRCQTFDEGANGYVRSEGAAALVLKTLSKARADGDRILAVISGSAINQDGASGGLTVPNGPSQVALIRQALKRAGVEPAEVDYIEAHGTGTALGDPIEVGALAEVFGASHSARRPLLLGSVKTVLGHLEVAAGMPGLIKVILALQNQRLPGHPHLRKLNGHIPWQRLPFAVPTHCRPWPKGEKPRIAGVSAFGFSGTNAHIVLEEPPALEGDETGGGAQPAHLLCLSAKTQEALAMLAGRYADWLSRHRSAMLGALCWTANNGRAHLPNRLAIGATRTDELCDKLSAFARAASGGGVLDGIAPATEKRLAFLFSGQGAQYPGMGRELYEIHPHFKAAIDRCEDILAAHLDQPLTEILWGRHAERLNLTVYTQPALFALEYALASLWRHWGIAPSYVMGHSVGEFAAAAVAGVFSLEDGLELIAARGRLMQALPQDGAMAVVLAGRDAVERAAGRFQNRLSIAAVNAPDQTVVSGARAAVIDLCEILRAERGIRNKGMLDVSHAFHSPLMRPMLAEFEAVAARIKYSRPEIGFVSNVTGRLASEEVASAEYWARHILAPVDFMGGVQELVANRTEVLLEVGPKATLIGLAQACCAGEPLIAMASLRQNASDWSQMLHCLGTLFVNGFAPDWRHAGRCDQAPPAKLALPTYPFERRRYWLDDAAGPARPMPSESRWHPLLGRRLPNAALSPGDAQYETTLSARHPVYLADHRVYERTVLPAAAYLEMALAGIARQFPGASATIVNFAVQTAMVLPAQGEALVQSVFSNAGANRWRIAVFSARPRSDADAEDASWQAHVVGEIELPAQGRGDTPEAVDVSALRRQFEDGGELLEPAEFYRGYSALGLHYGGNFRSIRQLQRIAACESVLPQCLARIVLPESLRSDAAACVLHPVLLDGCFQALGAMFPDQGGDIAYLPVGIERLRVWGAAPTQLWTHAALRGEPHASDARVIADIRLFDDNGKVIAVVEGLQAVPVTRRALAYATASWKDKLYAVNWTPQPRRDAGSPAAAPARQGRIILGDERGFGERLAALLTAEGQECVVIRSGDVSFCDKSAWLDLLVRRSGMTTAALGGIVHLWALDEVGGDRSPDAAQPRLCGSTLALTQALLAMPDQRLPRLWLVTQGAQAATDAEPVNAVQATLWGLGRTIALEQPSLDCTCIDLDIGARAPDDLVADLVRPEAEPQIAYRSGRRLVARLGRVASLPARQRLSIPGEAYRLRASEYGSPDRLTLQAMRRTEPAAHEVEIEVRAAALNFKDVLYCLGMLRQFSERAGIAQAIDQPLGFECAGRILRVGSAVTGLMPGDEVFAMAPSAMASHVTVDGRLVHRKPRNLTFEQAAALPTIFMTAIYSLERLARIKAGERVLIHAAAGGVGQAALEIARRAGATVYATASPAKWPHLQRQGVAHVMNSRTLEFAEEIMRLTDGRGVDVVLNSLSGDFIPRSADVLAKGGRFVEIGKIGIWDAAKMAAYRPDIGYFSFDLGDIDESGGALQAELLADVVRSLEAENLAPPPVTSFPIEQAPAAFRRLAQARNVGKVVLSLPEAERPTRLIRPDRSYLITGGWGALGRRVAQSLVENGARHVVLAGRSAPDERARTAISALSGVGAEIHLKTMDVADAPRVAAVLEEIARDLPPLGGIVHAAGVLDDGIIVKQDWPRFARVLAPKVAGAWNLHMASAALKLDFFVLFSSIASVMGAPGQGNYAAANAFMDALAQHRKSRGLPVTCINWGPWAAAGMAERTRDANRARFESFGVTRLAAEDGIEVLEHLIEDEPRHLAVLDVSWPRFLNAIANPVVGRFYSLLAKGSAAAGARDALPLLDRLLAEPEQRREALLVDELRQEVAAVVGLAAPDQIALQQPLLSFGIDSLMAVELKNRIESRLRCTLAPTLLLDHPTLAALGSHLARKVLNLAAPPAGAVVETAPAGAVCADAVTGVDRSPAAMQEFFIESGGRRLCLCRWGAKDAPLVICVHGMLDQAAIWDDVASGLVANGFGVMAPDLRGHGRSDHHPAGVTITAMDFLLDLTRAVGEEAAAPFVLVGHSMGSLVCGLYASLHPDKVRHLVMVEPVAPAIREQHAALELLDNDLRYIEAAPMHPVYPDLASAARMLTLGHAKLTRSRSIHLAERITEPCEGGLRWRWDPRLRNPLGIDLHVSRDHYLAIMSGLKIASTRVYGTASQFAGTPVLLDPSLSVPLSRSACIDGGHNLHTDNPSGLLRIILEGIRATSGTSGND